MPKKVIDEAHLIEVRHKLDLYTIDELCTMFGCGRSLIDNALATNKLRYISPNNKIRYINLKEFIRFMENQPNSKGKDIPHPTGTNKNVLKLSKEA